MDFMKVPFSEPAVTAFFSPWEILKYLNLRRKKPPRSYTERLAAKEAEYSTFILCKTNFWKCFYFCIFFLQSLRMPLYYFYGSALFISSFLHLPASFYSAVHDTYLNSEVKHLHLILAYRYSHWFQWGFSFRPPSHTVTC